jgi:hypothetical protein
MRDGWTEHGIVSQCFNDQVNVCERIFPEGSESGVVGSLGTSDTGASIGSGAVYRTARSRLDIIWDYVSRADWTFPPFSSGFP